MLKFTPKLKQIVRKAALLLLAVVVAGGSYWFYVRVITNNFHAVIPGVVYRSAQPSPKHLEKWVQRYGIRSVINLRGSSSGSYYADEVEAAARLGLELVSVRLSANRQPSSVQLKLLIEALETLPQPILLHCRDGSDRAGVASVVAAMAIGGQDYHKAKAQLSPVYLHIDRDPYHIGGLVVEYERHCQKSGISPGPWEHFRSWVTKEYKPFFYNVQLLCPDWPDELSARPDEKPLESHRDIR